MVRPGDGVSSTTSGRSDFSRSVIRIDQKARLCQSMLPHMNLQHVAMSVAMARVTTAAAARQLGVSAQTIRRWMASGRLQGVRDNHGNILVELDATGVAATAISEAPSVATAIPEPTMPVSQAMAMVAELQARVDSELAAERARHDAEIERLIGQVHAEHSFWVERADAAEVRAEAADQRGADMAKRLADLSERLARPWWRRWL